MISVPAGREFLVQPRLSKALGGPPSIIQLTTCPSGPLTSRWIHTWGLIQSILLTVPRSLTGLLASNSASKEWWAQAAPAMKDASNAQWAAANKIFDRIGSSLIAVVS